MNLNASEAIAYEFLKDRGNNVTKSTKSPDFIGDGTFEVKRVYYDRHQQKHVVFSRGQYERMRQSFPSTHYLLVESKGQITEVPLRDVNSNDLQLKVNGSTFIIHWTPASFVDVRKIVLTLDEAEAQRIAALKSVIGMQNSTELLRYSLKYVYDRFIGSPNPNGKKK